MNPKHSMNLQLWHPLYLFFYSQVREGGGAALTTATISAYDPDTDQSDLWFILEEAPKHGQLLLQEVPLPQGDRFQLEDIKLNHVRYVHPALLILNTLLSVKWIGNNTHSADEDILEVSTLL